MQSLYISLLAAAVAIWVAVRSVKQERRIRRLVRQVSSSSSTKEIYDELKKISKRPKPVSVVREKTLH